VCEPECPWEAIFEDEQVPEVFVKDTELNAAITERREEFEVPEHEDVDPPTPEQVEENRQKWAYSA
jgi:ferredoxin